MTTFYTSEAAMARHFAARSRAMGFRAETPDEARRWQEAARPRLADVLGLRHFVPVSPTPEPEKIESVHLDDVGLTRETWRIRTEEDVWMPFYLFVPDGLTAPAPLVLCPHGHGSAGKWATGGRRDLPGMAATIDDHRYDYGVQIARCGFVTACSDARGFGERREPAVQSENRLLDSSCHYLMLSGAPLGLTVQGMWTWDLMRLLDHLSADPRIDSARVGSAGLSGGGLQTLDLAALDTRIRAAVVSGYFYGVRESLQVQNGNCDCNLVPGLWESFDMGDLGALIAGRDLFIETGDADSLNGVSGLANVTPQVEIARRAFDLLGGDLRHHVFSGPHRWDGDESIPWLIARLREAR
jgi:hypothetical protein